MSFIFVTTFCLLVLVKANYTYQRNRINCEGLESAFYCVDSTKYNWCYGQLEPQTVQCPASLECKCGKTIYNPCMWPYQEVSFECIGKPGDFFGDNQPEQPDEPEIPEEPEQPNKPEIPEEPKPEEPEEPKPEQPETPNEPEIPEEPKPEQPEKPEEPEEKPNKEWPDVEEGIYSMKPNTHLPLVLKFEKDKWKEQIQEVVQDSDYRNKNAYKKESDLYECSLHPPSKYDSNPTQMFIGRPSRTVTISHTDGVAIRLPDKYYGLFLGYAMDMYGLNPSMIIGLGAKESFSFARYQATDDGSYFIVKNENEHYDCYANDQRGLCRDGNLDGPFQVETGGMATDVAILPNRFWIGDQSTPKSERSIKYMYDNEVLTSPNFREYHDYYTLEPGRAHVLTSLDFHFRHNMIMNLKKVGLIEALAKRATREQKDSLEFATAMYTYNRGVFDTQLIQMLKNCEAHMDPCSECKLDGYGGHSTDIRTVCKVVDTVPENEIYDYDITMDDIEYFIETLETTYPFDNVDWSTLKSDVSVAFTFLKESRGKETISFRYDWRTLLAVIRMHLPPIEYFVGDQVKSFQEYWGKIVNNDSGPYQSPSSFPYPFCSTSGGRSNLCESNQQHQVHITH